MRVTITKTIEMEQIPSEINEALASLTEKFDESKQLLDCASTCAEAGKYIDSAEELERLRQSLVLIDKRIEEQQSLCLSYEKLRINKQMPDPVPGSTAAPDLSGDLD
tara:strand:+ start:2730 stop:3050 length:321 start_codon:yes stop_codon:yes gene_type:complete